MSAYLDGLGVRVVRARDGAEGLETIRRVKPVAAFSTFGYRDRRVGSAAEASG